MRAIWLGRDLGGSAAAFHGSFLPACLRFMPVTVVFRGQVGSVLHTQYCTLSTAHSVLHTQYCTLKVFGSVLHTQGVSSADNVVTEVILAARILLFCVQVFDWVTYYVGEEERRRSTLSVPGHSIRSVPNQYICLLLTSTITQDCRTGKQVKVREITQVLNHMYRVLIWLSKLIWGSF